MPHIMLETFVVPLIKRGDPEMCVSWCLLKQAQRETFDVPATHVGIQAESAHSRSLGHSPGRVERCMQLRDALAVF